MKIFDLFSLWIFVPILDYYIQARIVHSEETFVDMSRSKCFVFREKDKLCKNVPYNQTTFPNRLGHVTVSEAMEEFKDFFPLFDVNCSSSLQQFLCFVYFPPCTIFEEPIRACRSYCKEAVTTECRKILDKFKKRPPVLECGNYPLSSEEEVCIKPDNTISKGGDSVSTATTGPFYDEETSLESKEVTTPVDLYLLVTSGTDIQLLDISYPHVMDTITLFRHLPPLMTTTIDYYEPAKYIFWASNTDGKILRGTLVVESLRDIRPIVDTESASVESIVVDWNLKVLFWTESVPVARLRTSSLSGRLVTTLLSHDMKYPISLSIDPLEGKLFWIDRRGVAFDQSSSIECYSILSEEHSTIFNITSMTIVNGGRATGLTVDIGDKRIYFLDARSQSLHSINYDGSGHTVLLSEHQYMKEPDSLALHGDHIVWIDKVSNTLLWADKKTGENELVIKIFESGAPQNIKIFGGQGKNISTTSYDKSSLTSRWQELSSKENMADLKRDDDGEFYDYEDDEFDEYGDQNTRKRNKKKSAADTLSPSYKIALTLCLIYIYLVS